MAWSRKYKKIKIKSQSCQASVENSMRKFSVCYICSIKEKNVWTLLVSLKPLPKDYHSIPQKLYYSIFIWKQEKHIFYKLFLQTSRSIGRKSHQSCLRGTAWLVFEVRVLACIRWPKYWSFSFNISPSNEHPGLISYTLEKEMATHSILDWKIPQIFHGLWWVTVHEVAKELDTIQPLNNKKYIGKLL